MKKILIADDHDVVRAGLQRIISREFDDVEFIEAADSNEVLGKVANENPNLVLADIKMPGRSGIDILKENGAAGFVNKAHVNAELPTAIRRASEGGRYVSPQLAEVLAHYLGNKHARVPHESLSEREMQVMRLIASGRETGEIASDLCLSDKTIATYRSRIYEKLNVKNNVEIARYAMQHRLVD